MENYSVVNIKTSIGIKLTLIPFIFYIFLKIGTANTPNIVNFSLVLFYFWVLSILLAKPRDVFKILYQKHYLALFIFILFMYFGYSYVNGLFATMKFIGAFIQVFAPIFMYEFYSKFLSNKTLRNLIVVTLGIYVYYSVKTNLFLELNPLAAREMISIGVDDSLLIGGGFSLSYGFAILVPVLVYFMLYSSNFEEYIIISNKITRLLLVIVAILFITTIYKSMFTISFIIMLLGSFFAFYKMRKGGKSNNITFVLVFLISLFIIVFINQYLPSIQSYLQSLNTVIGYKLLAVFESFDQGEVVSGGGFKGRVDLYFESFYTWIENPFMGIAYENNFDRTKMMEAGLGSHSEWFDLFAKYGLLGILLLIYIFKPKKVYKKNKGYKLALLLFFIIGFLNPIHLFNIYFIVFFYVPLLDNYFFNYKIKYGL